MGLSKPGAFHAISSVRELERSPRSMVIHARRAGLANGCCPLLVSNRCTVSTPVLEAEDGEPSLPSTVARRDVRFSSGGVHMRRDAHRPANDCRDCPVRRTPIGSCGGLGRCFIGSRQRRKRPWLKPNSTRPTRGFIPFPQHPCSLSGSNMHLPN